MLMLYRSWKFAELFTIKPQAHAMAKASLLFRGDMLKFDSVPDYQGR